MAFVRATWVHDNGYDSIQNLSTLVVENEKPRPVVLYDHEGTAYVRERQPLGFDLGQNKAT